jgi:hypothetical protein
MSASSRVDEKLKRFVSTLKSYVVPSETLDLHKRGRASKRYERDESILVTMVFQGRKTS